MIQFDSIRNEGLYHPVRVKGSSVSSSLVQPQEIDLLTGIFFEQSQGESKASFRTRFTELISATDEVRAHVIRQDD